MRAYPACRSFLAPLPSRSFIYRNGTPIVQQRRNFHSSRPHYAVDWLIEASVSGATTLFQGIHSATGLPWVASLPLTALGVRAVIASTLQKKAIEHSTKQANTVPLLIGWKKFHEKDLTTPGPDKPRLPPGFATKYLSHRMSIVKKKLYAQGKVNGWYPYLPFLQFPIFLALMESLRRMTGMEYGLLGVLKVWWTEAPSNTASPAETSMATEGALWFPDLLAADPYSVLPLILSTVLFANATSSFKSPSSLELAEMPTRQAMRYKAIGGVKFCLQAVSIYMFPSIVYAQVPSGLVVYWISSALFANLSGRVLKRVLPRPTTFKPCREKGVGSIHDP